MEDRKFTEEDVLDVFGLAMGLGWSISKELLQPALSLNCTMITSQEILDTLRNNSNMRSTGVTEHPDITKAKKNAYKLLIDLLERFYALRNSAQTEEEYLEINTLAYYITRAYVPYKSLTVGG